MARGTQKMHLRPSKYTFYMILDVDTLSYRWFYIWQHTNTLNGIHNTTTNSSMLLPNKYRNYA